MVDNSAPNPNWRVQRLPTHLEIEYRLREGTAIWIITAIGGGCVLFFGYWTAVILRSVLAAPAQMGIPGVVVLLIAFSGLAFGAYTVARLFGSARYLLYPEHLEVVVKEPHKTTVTEIQRHLVAGLTRVYTPSRTTRGEGTFKLILNWQTPEKQSRWISFEGDTKAESEWLGAILAAWSGKPIQEERSES